MNSNANQQKQQTALNKQSMHTGMAKIERATIESNRMKLSLKKKNKNKKEKEKKEEEKKPN